MTFPGALTKRVILVSTLGQGGMLSVIQALLSSSLASTWRLEVICSHQRGSLLSRLGIALRAYLSVFWRLCCGRVTLLHVHVAERGSFFRKSIFVWMAAAFHVPVVMHMHGAEFETFHAHCPRWVQAYITATLNQSGCIMALSEHWRAFYTRISHARVEVISNFIQAVHKEVPLREGRYPSIGVLFLGRYGPRKGIDDLIKAVSQLETDGAATLPEFEVLCGGDGDRQSVRRAVEVAGLCGRFQVAGWIDQPQRAEWIDRCELFVLPSYAEGLPVAIIEAMEAGLAILATSVGGIPEMVEHGVNGWLFEAGDVDGLTAGLAGLLTDATLRQRLGRAARQHYLSHYSEQAVISRIDAIYRDLVFVRPAQAAGRKSP